MRISLKVAITLDGKIAMQSGQSKWITGPEARQYTHRLRHEHAAILVGIGTILVDNPSLDTREISGGRSPAKVILDSRGRLPRQAKCLRDPTTSVFWLVGSEAPPSHENLPDHVHRIVAPTFRPEVPWLLSVLDDYQLGSLLVEGGAAIHASFLQSGLCHQLFLFVAPRVMGAEGQSWCGTLGLTHLDQTPWWHLRSHRPLGPDLLLEYEYIGRKHDLGETPF